MLADGNVTVNGGAPGGRSAGIAGYIQGSRPPVPADETEETTAPSTEKVSVFCEMSAEATRNVTLKPPAVDRLYE